ncbi:hypothetical protein SAMN05421812_115187 [Asanoa hainanensis]|uniref:Uncharacterized protein n=1 Tax=Asanoa hainanensis TaxID=560556 RepID=A0A239PAV8_9ACTN|nr:hypothetical protein [Asanoa hainanensis]SNT63688.1 hypothetical protein SAMN05421812_115187 [Asanoa hainanensis]
MLDINEVDWASFETPVKVRWRGDEDGRLVTCDEELRQALAEAERDAARQPLIAVVTLQDGDSLSMAVAGQPRPPNCGRPPPGQETIERWPG